MNKELNFDFNLVRFDLLHKMNIDMATKAISENK